jgi:hypothetical protein
MKFLIVTSIFYLLPLHTDKNAVEFVKTSNSPFIEILDESGDCTYRINGSVCQVSCTKSNCAEAEACAWQKYNLCIGLGGGGS